MGSPWRQQLRPRACSSPIATSPATSTTSLASRPLALATSLPFKILCKTLSKTLLLTSRAPTALSTISFPRATSTRITAIPLVFGALLPPSTPTATTTPPPSRQTSQTWLPETPTPPPWRIFLPRALLTWKLIEMGKSNPVVLTKRRTIRLSNTKRLVCLRSLHLALQSHVECVLSRFFG